MASAQSSLLVRLLRMPARLPRVLGRGFHWFHPVVGLFVWVTAWSFVAGLYLLIVWTPLVGSWLASHYLWTAPNEMWGWPPTLAPFALLGLAVAAADNAAYLSAPISAWRLRHPPHRVRERTLVGERGSVSVLLAIFATVFLLAAGLAVDGGRKLSATREAVHVAQSAARVAAQAIDIDLARSGELVLIPADAADAAHTYLDVVGHPGTVTVTGDAATVTVTVTFTPVILPVGPTSVSATATAAATSLQP